MINDIIEIKRKNLYQTIGLVGLSSEETIKVSQELERFINFHTRVSRPLPNMKGDHAKVHSNALENILEISAKEKLDLPFEINDNFLEFAEWFPIDLVQTLLHALTERYGNEIVAYIGEFVPIHCIFPQSVQSFRESLQHLNFIFQLNHKSASYIGEYLPFMDIKNEIVLFCHTPHYPTAFNYGIIKGLSKKFNHALNIKEIDQSGGGHFKIVS